MHKGVWYDESLLVPFIIRWPGTIEPGRDDLLLSVPDLMPSLLSLMGQEDGVPAGVEGCDYSGVFRQETIERPHSALYLSVNPECPAGGNRGLRTDRYTFVLRNRDGAEEPLLFDNRADPYQMRDVADSRPEVVSRLGAELMEWLERTGDPWVE
jgi:arylsulfatase A-like enzyme